MTSEISVSPRPAERRAPICSSVKAEGVDVRAWQTRRAGRIAGAAARRHRNGLRCGRCHARIKIGVLARGPPFTTRCTTRKACRLLRWEIPLSAFKPFVSWVQLRTGTSSLGGSTNTFVTTLQPLQISSKPLGSKPGRNVDSLTHQSRCRTWNLNLHADALSHHLCPPS